MGSSGRRRLSLLFKGVENDGLLVNLFIYGVEIEELFYIRENYV